MAIPQNRWLYTGTVQVRKCLTAEVQTTDVLVRKCKRYWETFDGRHFHPVMMHQIDPSDRNVKLTRIHTECASCGDPASWFYNERLYCRECYDELANGKIPPDLGPERRIICDEYDYRLGDEPTPSQENAIRIMEDGPPK